MNDDVCEFEIKTRHSTRARVKKITPSCRRHRHRHRHRTATPFVVDVVRDVDVDRVDDDDDDVDDIDVDVDDTERIRDKMSTTNGACDVIVARDIDDDDGR